MPSQIPAELAPGPAPFADEELDEVLETGMLTDDQLEVVEEQLDAGLVAVHRWQVTDDGGAEWAMRMLAAIDAERAAIADQYAIWIEPIVAWRDEQLARLTPRRDFFAGHLERYALRVRAENPRRATISLPSGKVTTTAAQKPTVEIMDEEAVLKWAGDSLPAEEYELAVKTTTKPQIVEIRRLVKVEERRIAHDPEHPEDFEEPTVEHVVVWASTGEIVPGLSADFRTTTAKATPAS